MKFERKVKLDIITTDTLIRMNELRIVFNIKKTRTSEQNKSEIKIYNLSETSRSKIKDEGKHLKLYAGYKDDIGLIFRGDIREVYHIKDGADIITHISAGDGDNSITNTSVNKTIKRGTPLIDKLNYLVGLLAPDIKKGKFVGVDGLEGNKTATTFTGKVRDELDRLAEKYDFEYTIENHILNIVRNKQNTGLSEIISPETGMIGVPIARENNKVEVKCLLNNKLKCNDLFRLESKFIKRDYRIEALTFEGDNYSTNTWINKIDGVAL